MTKEIKQLEKKIVEATLKGDYMAQFKYKGKLNAILKAEQEHTRTTLLDCIADRTPEERREATTRVIYAIATADLLYGATMDVEEYLRKEFGIVDIPIMEHLRDIVKQLHKVVKSIDDVGSGIFSDRYMEIVDEIETKYDATMRNYILNRLLKASKQKNPA